MRCIQKNQSGWAPAALTLTRRAYSCASLGAFRSLRWCRLITLFLFPTQLNSSSSPEPFLSRQVSLPSFPELPETSPAWWFVPYHQIRRPRFARLPCFLLLCATCSTAASLPRLCRLLLRVCTLVVHFFWQWPCLALLHVCDVCFWVYRMQRVRWLTVLLSLRRLLLGRCFALHVPSPNQLKADQEFFNDVTEVMECTLCPAILFQK